MWQNWKTNERDTVVRMWKDGHSASEIAREIGDGRTRSSVLGFLHRLRRTMPDLERLQKRNQSVKRAYVRTKPREQKGPPAPIPQINLRTPIPEISPPEGGVPYYETTRRHCKYILNTSKDPNNIKCCGHVRFKESSWCEKHYREVFITRIGPETRGAR